MNVVFEVAFAGKPAPTMECDPLWERACPRMAFIRRLGQMVHVPPDLIGCSEFVANTFEIVSQGDEALVLRLPIRPRDQESFGLALAISYKLEDHRSPRHRTIFNVLDIHRHYVSGVGMVGEQGTFNYRLQQELAAKLSPTEPWFLTHDELRD
jgi:hypothetical protein